MSRSLKKKVRDGQCHCSVCDQLRVGDENINFYGVEEDSADSGKSCKCNKVVLSKVCWMLSQVCFQCENLPDSIITDKNRGNFYWYTGTEKKVCYFYQYHFFWYYVTTVLHSIILIVGL